MSRINLTIRQSILLIFFIQNLLYFLKIFYGYRFVIFVASASSVPWKTKPCPTAKEKAVVGMLSSLSFCLIIRQRIKFQIHRCLTKSAVSVTCSCRESNNLCFRLALLCISCSHLLRSVTILSSILPRKTGCPMLY